MFVSFLLFDHHDDYTYCAQAWHTTGNGTRARTGTILLSGLGMTERPIFTKERMIILQTESGGSLIMVYVQCLVSSSQTLYSRFVRGIRATTALKHTKRVGMTEAMLRVGR